MPNMTDYMTYIAKSRYARWIESQGRRETWEETARRYVDFFQKREGTPDIRDAVWEEIYNSVINLEVMPSMRCMMAAGEALNLDNVAGFNCSYIAVSGEGDSLVIEHEKLDEPLVVHMSKPRDFDEIMYILLCGTGVGFSVERQFIQNMPIVGAPLNRRIYAATNTNFPNTPKEELSSFDRKSNTILVADSKYGWASAMRILVVELFNGNFDVKLDVSKVRPAGARLKTFGGRASGPQPLVDLFEFTVKTFKAAAGRRLSSIECHDIVCKVADIVVVGGVRRSALISLSNLTDDRMRHAKDNLYYQKDDGSWGCREPQRALANNSVCYTEMPDVGTFLKEWSSLYESKSGERGIFNRESARNLARRTGRRDWSYEFGTNPCSEIILRSKQFCNLSEVVVRPNDTLDDLRRKVRIATILGTLQATLTDFRYLSKEWKKNTEEEALLGVSLTGIMDHPVMSNNINDIDYYMNNWNSEDLTGVLRQLKEVAIETNREWAGKLGINPSAAITCVKPSGTVSQLVDSASGIHPRHSPWYIRTVRTDKKDPLYQFMKDQGVYCEDAIGKEDSTAVLHFPMKAPEGSVFRDDRSAIDQLELWKVYAEHWCEHKPSITVYVKEDEWLDVGAWVYKNFDIVSGVSFLPYDGGVYQQAPYQEITEEQYNEWIEKFPRTIDWDRLKEYETEDSTVNTKELACSAGVCEI